MSRAAVIYQNLADDGSLSSSGSTVLCPIGLLQQEDIAVKWRSIGNSAWFVLDLGEEMMVSDIALIGILGEDIRCYASLTDPTGLDASAFDSGALTVDQNYKRSVFAFSAPAPVRYIRIELSHSASDYVEAGRLVVGNRSTFSINMSYGSSRGYNDPSQLYFSRNLQTRVSPEDSLQVVNAVFNFLTAADRFSFVEDIMRDNGIKKDILLMLDPDSDNLARDTVWGLITTMIMITDEYFNIYSWNIQMQERA